ncbi:myosin-9-like [Drosophila obscura]|uniref:myosin-9-like n=1 Tax=Drosophila obscura TaxID=7282 RepID=UPI001BB16062|nr:myosin-9-like [Drosophila obscura]
MYKDWLITISCKALQEKFADHNQMEMLSALSQKDLAKDNLRKTLDELSRDVLRNSRQEQMRFICPELESSCERICHKCLELERLVANGESKCAERAQRECDQLRVDIAETRTKLEDVQLAYSLAMCEVSEKTEDCKRLNLQLFTAQDDNARLQGKYDGMEQIWQSQLKLIKSMAADYNAVQRKYEKLQQEYEDLGRTSKASEEHGLQLEADSTTLQAEILKLRERGEETQRILLEAANQKALAEQFEAHNDALKVELSELKTSWTDMQWEFDCMSNQLVKSVKECDVLRNECSALQAENKNFLNLKKEFEQVCSWNTDLFKLNQTLRATLKTNEETFKTEKQGFKEHLNGIVIAKEELNSQLKSQLKSIKAENSALRNALLKQDEIHKNTYQKCLEMRQELNESRHSVKRLMEKDAASETFKNALSQQKLVLEEVIQNLNKEVESLRTKIKQNTSGYRTDMELASEAVNEIGEKHTTKGRKVSNAPKDRGKSASNTSESRKIQRRCIHDERRRVYCNDK